MTDRIDDGWENEIEITTIMRRTSLEAYRRIRDEGLLSKSRLAVYARLCRATEFDGEPITAGELKRFVRDTYGLQHVDGYHKRLSELVERDAAYKGNERACRATGYTATTWGITGRLPIDPETGKRITPTPSKSEFHEAAELFKHWRNTAILNGEPVSDAVDKTIAYLQRKAK